MNIRNLKDKIYIFKYINKFFIGIEKLIENMKYMQCILNVFVYFIKCLCVCIICFLKIIIIKKREGCIVC